MPSLPPPPPPPPHQDPTKPPRPPMFVPTSSASLDSSSPLNASVKSASPQRGSSSHNNNNTTNIGTNNSSSLLDDLLTNDDQAERGLLQSMEERRSHVQTSGGDSWHASAVGERPPLGGAVPLDRMMLHTTSNSSGGSRHERRLSQTSSHASSGDGRSSQHTGGSANSATKLADIARRMRASHSHQPPPPQQQPPPQQSQPQRASNANNESSFNSGSTSYHSSHKRASSRAHALLDSIQEGPADNDETYIFDGVGNGGTTTGDKNNDTEGGRGVLGDLDEATSHADHLLTGAMQVEELFEDSPPLLASTEPEPVVDEEFKGDGEFGEAREQMASETSPLTASYQNGGDGAAQNYVSLNIATGDNNDNSARKSSRMMTAKTLREKAAMKKQTAWWLKLSRTCCHPLPLAQSIGHFLWYQTYLFTVALPCFVAASFFYYALFNPKWSFLPGQASVSWWLNFAGRQTILFEVARLSEWLLIDKVVLGTRIAVQCLGPLLTLCFIQSRGWPFYIAAWGFLDLMLLEGSSAMTRHWFWFSGLTMYDQPDSENIILNSDLYGRLLLSMVLGGFATAIKRTAVAMYFGRRTFVEFKPRLEKLLKDAVLVSELAALAEEAELAASEEVIEVTTGHHEQRQSQVTFLGDVSWNNTHRKNRQDGACKKLPVGSSDSDEDDDDDDDESEITTQNDIPPESQAFRSRCNSSGSSILKELLDHWEEPTNKADKSLNTSISDILRFRRALTFMDDDLMFGETFGPASTRDQLINSAQNVYNRLLMLTPGSQKVSCEFYDMLALEGDILNLKKRRALRKLFRPDAENEISLLAFVQCCDSLYKKLRYFRANVGSASVIDHALESIVDGAFSFVLVLVLLSVMHINPWPLLVSISTLLVSISFAVGSSASKWFEGTLLVAARRPFDLGDRIYMTDPSLINSDGLWYCWFVEDINLFHTTVRYAGTNEVATINNGSVANMRIINGARSPNAAVWFQFAYRPNLMEDGNVDKIKAALEGYARDKPRDWHSFGYFRVDEVHPELEKLVVTIGMQHHSSWQDLVRILEAKGAIMCWLMEYSRKLGVLYDVLPKRELMYYAGNLKEGGVRQHRFQLHDPTNITSGGFNMAPPPGFGNPVPGNTSPKAASDAKFLEQLKHSQG